MSFTKDLGVFQPNAKKEDKGNVENSPAWGEQEKEEDNSKEIKEDHRKRNRKATEHSETKV